jgi:hypothetical protein
MPRFAGRSRKFKGFAFIEFDSVDVAANVLEIIRTADKENPCCNILGGEGKTQDPHPQSNPNPLAGIKGMSKERWMALRDHLKQHMATKQAQQHMLGLTSTTTTPTSSSGTLRQAVQAASATSSSSSSQRSSSFFTPGLLLVLTNVPGGAPRKMIKAAIEKAAPVAFLDDSNLNAGGDRVIARFLSTSHTSMGIYIYIL